MNSLIVVSGDFNLIGMEKCESIEKEFLLNPVRNNQQATHKKGNHLDNVWANIPVTKTELVTGFDHLSDHALFKVSVRIGEEVKRTIPHKTASFFST